jgi:predicted transcriptional regulator
MDKIQIGESIKRKRSALAWSQGHLAWKAGVSDAVIGKIEKGVNVKEENLAKVLHTLGMREQLKNYREDIKIVNYKSMSLTDLRTTVQICKDFIRERDKTLQIEMASIKKIAEKEIIDRLRENFRGHDVNF